MFVHKVDSGTREYRVVSTDVDGKLGYSQSDNGTAIGAGSRPPLGIDDLTATTDRRHSIQISFTGSRSY